MKILLATFWTIPGRGGVWPVMHSLKEKLEELGHEVDILGKYHGGQGYQIINKKLGIRNAQLAPILIKLEKAKKIPFITPHQKQLYFMEFAAAYFGLEQYDMIHAHDVISARCLSRIKPKKTPLVVSIHGALARERAHTYQLPQRLNIIQQIKKTPLGLYFWRLEKLGIHSANVILTSNQWMKQLIMQDHGVPANRIVSFQYGIYIEKFLNRMNQRMALTKPPNKKVIMYAGRLVPIKGVNIFITALSQLKKTRKDWVCWIVGEGTMKKELIRQTTRSGLNQFVRFLGERDDVPALLGLADIFVLPSLQDNMPLSLIEAQVAGKAIVASNAGGIPEMIIHNQTGLIAPKGQSVPLYSHIRTLLENDSLRHSLSSNSKHWAMQHWSIDLMVNNILNVYKSVM